jgi:WD40 repeat protein/DNA-binding SARP family transcriptional activator
VGIAVLGPLSIDGVSEVLGRRDRVVLTALTVRPGHVLSAERLADVLWADHRPPSWAKVVQGCVVRLRKVLGPESIETSSSGYRLAIPLEQIDAQRFERAIERARTLLDTSQEADRAAFVLADALSLWRGEALSDLDGWDAGRIEAGRLGELRLEAEELYVEATLRAGHWDRVLARADAMVEEQPLRERRWALLALAQYQGGQQSDALRTLRRVRWVLTHELGLDPGSELEDLERAVLQQDPSLVEHVALPEPSAVCPYRGLLPYDTDDADSFFGRDTDVTACLRRLGATRVLAVVGPSGTGKSSMVRAGVVASLRRDGRDVLVMTPGPHPSEALAALPHRKATSTLVLDQCEEVFSLCQDATERTRFLDALVRHAATGTLVVVLRADHLADLAAHRDFAGIVERGLHLMAGMREDELRAAIVEPARLAGLSVEPALVQILVQEVSDSPGALPLMSHALRETWERREARTLTVAGYQASGGIQEAVSRSAEEVYSRVEGNRRTMLRSLMLRLVTSGPEGEPVRSRLPRRVVVTDPAHDELVDLLVGSRLVTSDDGIVEVAHEALARAWPRLRTWLEEDVEGQRILHHLAMAADSWESLGRPASELYRGVRLAQALDWRMRTTPDLSETEQSFLDTAGRASQADLRAAEDRAREQARVNRRLRLLLVGAAVLLLSTVVAGLAAVRQTDRAKESANTADARRVGARALASENVAESLLLAVEGVRIDDSAETHANLFSVLAERPQLIGSNQVAAAQITGLDVSPSGDVAVYDLLGRLLIVDSRTGAVRARYDPGDGPVPLLSGSTAVAFSPSGKVVAVGLPSFQKDSIRLLDAGNLTDSNLRLGGQPTRPTRTIDVAFSADGRYVAASFRHLRGTPEYAQFAAATVSVWDLQSPRHPVRRIDITAPPQYGSVALSADGSRLYTSMPLAAYDVATGERIFAQPTHVSYLLELSPDGRRLAIADVAQDNHAAGAEILVVDARTGTTLQRLNGHTEQVYALRFSPDGSALASTSDDRSAVLWDLASGTPSQRLRLDEPASQITFSPDGATLYTGGLDQALRSWDLTGRQRFLATVIDASSFDFGFINPAPGGGSIAYQTSARLRFLDVAAKTSTNPVDLGPGYAHAGGSWTPHADRFATATGSQVRVWDPHNGRLVRTSQPFAGPLSEIDYSTDGSRLVVGEVSGRVTLLDADSLKPVGKPVDLGTYICCVSAGPDNRTVIALIGGSSSQSDDFSEFSDRWATMDLVSGRVLDGGRLGIGGNWVSASPDGAHAAVAGGNGEVLLLDLASGTAARPPVTAHDDVTNLVVFSKDGSRLASAAWDGTVVLWDGRTGALLGRVVAPSRIPASAEFLPDGKDVLIATYDRAVYRWDTRVGHAVDFACRLAGRNLTRDEWASAFDGQPYRKTCPSAPG